MWVLIIVFLFATTLSTFFFGLSWLPVFVLLFVASIDNGSVLAEKALGLPKLPVPWPRWIPKRLKQFLDSVFSDQRQALPWIGLGLSLPMKSGFAFFTGTLLHNRWVLLVAGFYFVDLALESFFSKSFLTYPVIWIFRQILLRVNFLQVKRSFWLVVLSIDVVMESFFSIDESILASSRLSLAIAAAAAMVISTFAMRLGNGPMQKMIELRPIIGKAIYVSIFALGIELCLDFLGFNVYKMFHIEWIKPVTSLLIVLVVVFVAEIIRWSKVIFTHGRRDIDN